jgi:uncharacterized protein (DUF58 family)
MIASRRLYILLIVGIVVFAVTFFVPVFRMVGYAFDILVLSVVVADNWLTQPRRYLSATRETADRLSIGRENPVLLEVLNQGKQNLRCRVRDDFPRSLESDVNEFDFALKPFAKAKLMYNLLPRQRGEYKFENINIRYLSRLGLFWCQLRVKAQRSVRVYSDLHALKELSIKLSHSSELGDLRMKRRGQGTDFASLREYVVGDDSRKIDWKATARKDRPVVRVYEVEQEQNLLVLVDAGRMMVSDLEGLSRFDHALNAALSLVLTGLHRNDRVGLGIFADKPIMFLPPRRGRPYLTTMLEAVCDIKPRVVEPDYTGALSFFASAHKQRSLITVLTDLTDPTGSQALLTGLASLSPRHLPFCVTLRDRQVDKIAAQRNTDVDGAFKRAVATDLTSQREVAFSHLVRRGCMVLDAPPQDLCDRLVNRYLEIKARGRL